MRDGNPNNNQNWKLVCTVCGAEFLSNEKIDLAAGHFQQEHPELDQPNFTTVWMGKGPAPKPGRGRSQPHQRRRR